MYCLEDIKEAGIKDIGIILGENMPEKVRELLSDGSEFDVDITYIEQGTPKGIAHAVGCAEEFMEDDSFVVYLGDNILKGGIKKMVEEFVDNHYDAAVALTKVLNPEMFGVAELNKKGEIINLVEKPKKPKSDLALVGIYLLRKSIFPIIHELKPSWRNELEITDAIDDLRKSGKKVHAHIVTDWWKDIGKPEDILEANHLILDDLKPYNNGKLEKGAAVKGKVCIGEGTLIKKGSVIRGPAVIGKNCVIGPDAYIGPYTAIGDNTTIINGEIESGIVID